MSMLWTKAGPYRQVGYADEADLESAILEVEAALFGPHRLSLNVKKKIDATGGQRNIPDGYLLDLSDARPRLYVVENELAAHDPLRHVAVQLLQFSLSFEAEPRQVKTVLFHALQERPDAQQRCEEYAAARGVRNLDHLLEAVVFEGPFAALVIIDELGTDLEHVLVRKFQFGVEVLELVRSENARGERSSLFEPFLADVSIDAGPTATLDLDTVVVPARAEGFPEVLLGEQRWRAHPGPWLHTPPDEVYRGISGRPTLGDYASRASEIDRALER